MDDKWWAAELSHGAFCCAAVCSALSRVLSESDRQVDLSRRTRRERLMLASVCSVIVQMGAVAGIGDGPTMSFSWCGGGRALGGVIFSDFKVGTFSFAF